MVPLAPVRFSTTIDWPIWAATCSSTILGTMSTALPAVSGTTARMVRAGHCCAMAGAERSAMRVANSTIANEFSRFIRTSLARRPRDASFNATPPKPRDRICVQAWQKYQPVERAQGAIRAPFRWLGLAGEREWYQYDIAEFK